MGIRIGFVGARFAGTDGVSLESAKWAEVLWHHRHVSYWYGGKLDRDPDISLHVPLAYFGHPDIEWINQRVFGVRTRAPEVTRRIYAISDYLKGTLYEFTRKFNLDLLIAENCLTIPMNIPLGIAFTHFIAETGFPVIAHHHDFYWERDRFSVNAVGDLLSTSFPPTLPSIQHVTINSAGQQALSHRRGEAALLIPNVLDFEQPPSEPDEYALAFRRDIGLAPDDILFLQPTRVVPRKGIEHAIAAVGGLRNPKCKLVVSHDAGDEGHAYVSALQDLAEQEQVDLRFVSARVGEFRALNPEGQRVYTLADAYSQADFVTYPSLYEGFGNALLEAFYYRKPLLVNRYSIFVTDIEPRGARVIAMNGFVTRDTVAQIRRVIQDDQYRAEMVAHNYELGRAFYSYTVLRRKLRVLITNITGAEDF